MCAWTGELPLRKSSAAARQVRPVNPFLRVLNALLIQINILVNLDIPLRTALN